MNKGIIRDLTKHTQAHSSVHDSDSVSAVKRDFSLQSPTPQESEPVTGKENRYFFSPLVTYHEHLLELKGKFLINQIYDLFNVQAFAKSECKVLHS